MTKEIDYQTRGTCSRSIHLKVEDGIIRDVSFFGGCNGNTQGIAALVIGMKASDAAERLRGIRCGMKNTSCPDQLAKAIDSILTEN